MFRIIIRGSAAVFRDDEPVTDSTLLRSLAGIQYTDERFTDYLGGTAEEDAIASALESGGCLQFNYREGDSLLIATTEFRARRDLTTAELQFLVDDTMGQWSDGIGENWACESAARCGYTIMCLTRDANPTAVYPIVDVSEEL